jgi:hypothetical protein
LIDDQLVQEILTEGERLSLANAGVSQKLSWVAELTKVLTLETAQNHSEDYLEGWCAAIQFFGDVLQRTFDDTAA